MATFVSDTFTDTNGTGLGSHTPNIGGAWGSGSTYQINNNSVAIPGAFTPMSLQINATTASSSDYEVSIDVLAVTSGIGNGDWMGVIGRGIPGAGNFYAAYYNANYGGTASEVRLSKFVGNAETVLGTYGGITYTQNVTHNIKLQMSGTTIKVLVDGTVQINITDSTYTTGNAIGIISAASFNMALAGDNFLAADVTTGGSATVTPPTIACVGSMPAPTAPAPSGVQFDATSNAGPYVAGGSVGSLTWTHTCGSGSNRLVIVNAVHNSSADGGITMSATYGGVSMTSLGVQHAGANPFGFIQKWYLVNPPTGASTVVVTSSTPSGFGMAAGAISYTGVDQTTPTRNFASAANASGGSGDTSVSLSVTSAANNMVDIGVCYGGFATISGTGGGTTRWVGNEGNSNGGANVALAQTFPGASTISTTYSAGNSDVWAAVGVDIQAAGTGGGGTGATVTPIAITCISTVPNPAIQAGGNATVLPVTISGIATVPQIGGGLSASVAATTIVGTATLPAPTVNLGKTLAPPTIAGTSTLSAPTITTVTGTAPVTILGTATLPAPTINLGKIATPPTIAEVTTMPVPQVNISYIVTPPTISCTSTLLTPTVNAGSNVTVTPPPIVGMAALPSPTITIATTVIPVTILGTASTPAPAIAFGVTVTPVAIAGTSTVPQPAIQFGGGANVQPSTIQVTTSINIPNIERSINPPTIIAQTTLPSPNITISSQVTPATITATAAMAQPGLVASTTATPNTISAIGTVPAPAIGSVVTAHPTTIVGFCTVPSPTVTTIPDSLSRTVTPITIVSRATLPSPQVIGGLFKPYPHAFLAISVQEQHLEIEVQVQNEEIEV